MFINRLNRLQDCVTPPSDGRTRTTVGIRTELVERVRREIAAGTYETPEKWEAAFDRLLDTLA